MCKRRHIPYIEFVELHLLSEKLVCVYVFLFLVILEVLHVTSTLIILFSRILIMMMMMLMMMIRRKIIKRIHIELTYTEKQRKKNKSDKGALKQSKTEKSYPSWNSSINIMYSQRS